MTNDEAQATNPIEPDTRDWADVLGGGCAEN